MRTSLRGLATLALVTTSLQSCDLPSGPKVDPTELTLGRASEGSVSGTDSLTYHLHAKAGGLFVVFVDARDSGIVATVFDPSGQYMADSYHSGARARGESIGWEMVTASTEGEYTVRVRAAPPSRVGGRFTLRPTVVNSAPESTPALIQPNDTIATESLEAPGDVDDFQFDGLEGQQVNLFLQSLAPPVVALDISLVQIQSSGDQMLGIISGIQSDQEFEWHASGLITLPATGRYRVRIRSRPTGLPGTGSVPYRFQVYRVNRAPEHAPAALAIGDTVSDAIDVVGDIDEYTLSGTPGSMFNLFADAGGSAPHVAVVTVLPGDSPSGLASVRALPGQRLLDDATGTFTLPASGSVTVRVTDDGSNNGLHRGSYRLFVYPIDRSPEGQASPLVPSSQPVSEAIDQLGDIDEYVFTLADTATLSFRANLAVSGTPGLSMSMYEQPSFSNGETGATWRPGTYHFRVLPNGAGKPGTYRGTYQFVLAPVDSAPEDVPAAIVAGDTVRREAALWPHDVDQFHLTLSDRDTVIVELSHPDDAAWKQNLLISDGSTREELFGRFFDTSSVTPRIELTGGGSMIVAVTRTNLGWAPGTRSLYQLVVKRVSAAPEHHAASIALGDSVSEALDFSGDIDDYVLSGTPGQYLNLSGGWPVNTAPPSLSFQIIDPATGVRLNDRGGITTLDAPAVQIPAGGAVRVRVCVAANCAPQVCRTGSCKLPTHPLETYWFMTHAIDPAPEAIPANFVLSDTVAGEKLETKGDIDEFHFFGAAGQSISAQFQWLSGYYGGPGSTGLQLQIVDAATGDVLGTVYDESGAAQLGDDATAPIVLPRTAQYLVRVQAHWDAYWGWLNIGPYRFRVVTVP